ncbi:response regulator [Cohnella herbarum]|uniref:Response regulator n=1 Tax=Cohnella herbarum TaxID=2728023 RepID=A0A7Z2ZJJ0_9BACL|nr:response regulator [Cohnella herbarum]QJD82251.1 response regulator [Cohnella herbarum]
MLRVLIVDDEPIYRLALRELIRWEDYGCEIVGEASNGLDALRLVTSLRIDLVIADIQMPILSGIEFLKQLRESEEGRKIAVVVLSAYSQYEYVRQAFVYGVHDYIIKEDLNAELVGETIEKTVGRIGEANDKNEQIQRESLARSERMKEETLLSILLSETLPQPDDTFAEVWINAASGAKHVLCCLFIERGISAENRELDSQRSRLISHSIRQVGEGYRLEPVIASVGAREYALLFRIPGSSGELQAREIITDTANKIISHIRDYMNLSATVGVSKACISRETWPEQYRLARRWAEAKYYLGAGRAYFEEDIAGYPSQLQENAWDTQALVHDLESGNPEWRSKLDAGLDKLAKAYGVPVGTTLKTYQALLWEVGSLLYSRGLNWTDIGERNSPAERLSHFENAGQLNIWFRSLMQTVIDNIDPKKRILENSPPLVDKVKKWIDRHYQEPISLMLASEAAGISESYLSKIFAKETGETFIEYVTRRRVEQAILFMTSGMKIYEIAEKVGYPNQGHFSKIFKKVTGKTPLEYREQMLSK